MSSSGKISSHQLKAASYTCFSQISFHCQAAPHLHSKGTKQPDDDSNSSEMYLMPGYLFFILTQGHCDRRRLTPNLQFSVQTTYIQISTSFPYVVAKIFQHQLKNYTNGEHKHKLNMMLSTISGYGESGYAIKIHVFFLKSRVKQTYLNRLKGTPAGFKL
jgi:hypothetical protein